MGQKYLKHRNVLMSFKSINKASGKCDSSSSTLPSQVLRMRRLQETIVRPPFLPYVSSTESFCLSVCCTWSEADRRQPRHRAQSIEQGVRRESKLLQVLG